MSTHDGSEIFRAPVILRGDDRNLIIRLRAKIEADENKSTSLAEIIRIALRELAKAKGV